MKDWTGARVLLVVALGMFTFGLTGCNEPEQPAATTMEEAETVAEQTEATMEEAKPAAEHPETDAAKQKPKDHPAH